MAEEHLEVVQQLIDAYIGGDAKRASSLMDPYVVLDTGRVGEILGDAQGRDEVIKTIQSYQGAFSSYSFEVDKLTDLGSGAVVGVARETGVGRASGAEVERTYYVLYTVIDGLVARMTHFPTEAEAVQAAE